MRIAPAICAFFKVTRKAQRAWTNVQALARNRAPNSVAEWTLVGPTSANDPNVLTFSGSLYTTSGRVTALAIAPNCTRPTVPFTSQRLGAGFGKRTARSIPVLTEMEFHLGQFCYQCDWDIDDRCQRRITLYAGTGEPNASADSKLVRNLQNDRWRGTHG